MFKARLFRNNEIVTAEDVLKGKVSREENFVDPEEEFRVFFVKGAKNHGAAHFRLYMSREEYARLTPERKSRYDFLRAQRHYQESEWHREWEALLSPHAEIEKIIYGPDGRRKRSDAYLDDVKTCVEFQHSYIAYDYEERNRFYSDLGIKAVWLYDLTSSAVTINDDGDHMILEDNSKGFFRIAEKPENLREHLVFFQASDMHIYRVRDLARKSIDSKHASTIRIFDPEDIFTAEEFIDKIVSGDLVLPIRSSSVFELWDPSYKQMIITDTEEDKKIIIYRDRNSQEGDMQMSREHPDCIDYQYVEWDDHMYHVNSKKHYSMSKERAEKKVWLPVYSWQDEEEDDF